MLVLNLLVYVGLVAVLVAAFWYGARLIGLDRPLRGSSGLAWLDAADAFDRSRQRHRRHALAAAVLGRPHRLDLPRLDAGGVVLIGHRDPRERVIPIDAVVGTVDGAAGTFDRDFLPTDDRSRWRFEQIVRALREGEALPPIEVYQRRGRFYVADGHHRVAAARALGERSIPAYVTETRRAPRPMAGSRS